MAYTPTEWVNDVTPINAENLNKIENQLKVTSVDYIVKEGIADKSGNVDDNASMTFWTYRMWNSGMFEAWYASNAAEEKVSTSTRQGSSYRSDPFNYRMPAFNKGAVAISAEGSLEKAFSGVHVFQGDSIDGNGKIVYGNTLTVSFWSHSDVSDSRARLSLYIRGRYK
jgi:hypothetical protein